MAVALAVTWCSCRGSFLQDLSAAPGAQGSSGSITGGVHGVILCASSEQHSRLRSVHWN